MKRIVFYAALFSFSVLIFMRCSKAKDTENIIKKESSPTKDLKNHLLTSEEAVNMIKRYDSLIQPQITEKYQKQNNEYIAPKMVIYDIDPLIEFLEHIKAKGNTKVVVRYAAIDGDNINKRVPGLPYHSLLFYGQNTVQQKENLTDDEVAFFDHGQVGPPPEIKDPANP